VFRGDRDVPAGSCSSPQTIRPDRDRDAVENYIAKGESLSPGTIPRASPHTTPAARRDRRWRRSGRGYVRRSQGSPGMPPRQRCPPRWVVQVPLAACGWALVYEVTRASKADRQQTRTASISAASLRMLSTQVNTPAHDAPARPHPLRRPAARRPAYCTEKVGRGVGGTSRFRPTARSKTGNRYDDAWQYGKPRAMQ
jgi:hypothetical protein